MLNTILTSQRNAEGMRIVVREDTDIALDIQTRFMTHLEDTKGNFYSGHYVLHLSNAHEDYLDRVIQSKCGL